MKEPMLHISRRTFLGTAAACGALSLVSPLTAFAAPTAAEAQAEADRMRVQVNSLKADLLDKTNAYGAALDEHDQAVAAMESAQAQIDETSTKITGIQTKLGTRARSMYRGGGTSFLDILFGATSFTEFATNWDLLNKMNDDDAAMVSEAKTLREDFETAHAEYARQEKIAAAKTEEARKAKDAVEASADYYQGILNSLDEETRKLLLEEQEAAAVAAASQQIARQEEGGQTGGGSSGSSTQGGGGGNAADYGPPAGDILSEARKYLGCAYTDAGTSPATGFDCSGLVYYCCQRTGHRVPPRSTYGYPGTGWFPVSQAQPGDILWQQSHVGICAAPGGTSYVHAANKAQGVCMGTTPQFTRAYRY